MSRGALDGGIFVAGFALGHFQICSGLSQVQRAVIEVSPKNKKVIPMQRAETLREQARTMRMIAGTFDEGTTRQDLLRLAERCDELATKIERSLREAMSMPIGALKLKDDDQSA